MLGLLKLNVSWMSLESVCDFLRYHPQDSQSQSEESIGSFALTSSQATQKVVYMAMKHVYQTTCSMLGIKTMHEFDPRFLF